MLVDFGGQRHIIASRRPSAAPCGATGSPTAAHSIDPSTPHDCATSSTPTRPAAAKRRRRTATVDAEQLAWVAGRAGRTKPGTVLAACRLAENGTPTDTLAPGPLRGGLSEREIATTVRSPRATTTEAASTNGRKVRSVVLALGTLARGLGRRAGCDARRVRDGGR